VTVTRSSRALLAALTLGTACARAPVPVGIPAPSPAAAPTPAPVAAPRPTATSPRPLTPAEVVNRDRGIAPYVQADVDFMTGMIGHHAQAVLIARWAPTHDASPALRALAARIAVAQQDEIAFMQRWLRARGKPVPSAEPDPHAHHGADHGAHASMPGMLSAAQLDSLNAARGPAFDRLFLTYMIRHHEGAITMVEALLAAEGAARDEDVYKFAAEVNVDQTTEIDRMLSMLAALARDGRRP
jgi:uncharacterized protein (DUF305 family)